MPGPLEDITVIDFAQIAQGPVAAQMLGDMGAEVIKIEPPGGEWMRRNWSAANAFRDGVNLTFLTCNRNKKSVELDIKDEEQKAVVYDLVEEADVFIENFRPGVLDRNGLGYEDLSAINPELIYCASSGYGAEGPYSDRPGQDLLIQGMAGVMSVTGREDDPPTPAGFPAADLHTAANLAFAIVCALHHRDRTGEGQKIEGDLLSGAIHNVMMEFGLYLNWGELPERSEAGIANAYYQAPYGVYETADGYIALSLSYPGDVAEVLDIDGLRDVDTWEAAYERRDEIKREIERTLRTEPSDHWLDRLLAEDIWCGPVCDFEDVEANPQVRANDMIRTVEHAALGDIRLPGIPYRMSETPGSIRRAPPTAGEHTEEVLGDLGYPEEFIARVTGSSGPSDGGAE